MKVVLNKISNIELLGIVVYGIQVMLYLYTLLVPETDFTADLYYLFERFDALVVAVICYHIVGVKYHRLVMPAILIVLTRLINELMHVLGIIKLNNLYLLGFEFILITLYTIYIWRTSKTCGLHY